MVVIVVEVTRQAIVVVLTHHRLDLAVTDRVVLVLAATDRVVLAQVIAVDQVTDLVDQVTAADQATLDLVQVEATVLHLVRQDLTAALLALACVHALTLLDVRLHHHRRHTLVHQLRHHRRQQDLQVHYAHVPKSVHVQ